MRDGDVLIVWKPDRLGRSLPNVIETVTSLATCGVELRSIIRITHATTPGGRLVFHLFGALGQFECNLIQERTHAGLVAAAACGRKDGRKPVVTDEKLEHVRHHRQSTDRAGDLGPARNGESRAVCCATQLISKPAAWLRHADRVR